MKRKTIKQTAGLLVLTTTMMLPVIASAASYAFTFKMEHQLSIGSFKSTKGTVTATVSMSSWGGDDNFAIKIYERGLGSVTYKGKMAFYKSSAGSPYTSSNSSVTTGHTYGYEIWKTQNGKTIVGSGTLSY